MVCKWGQSAFGQRGRERGGGELDLGGGRAGYILPHAPRSGSLIGGPGLVLATKLPEF